MKRSGNYKFVEPVYTELETLQRLMDMEACRSLMNRRAYYIANEMRRQEIDDMWVTEPEYRLTASFGKNSGYYVGMDNIIKYYVIQRYEQRKAQLEALSRIDPTVENTTENLNIGCSCMHPITTPRLFLAADGKTAQGLWHSIGKETFIKENGTVDAHWIVERIGVDFIKETSGQWRIWHILQIHDISLQATQSASTLPWNLAPGDDPVCQEFGVPTIPIVTHDPSYNWEDNYPPVPKAYPSYSDAMSYGPKGHPRYKEDCRL